MTESSNEADKVPEIDRTKEDELIFEIVKTKYNDSLASWNTLDNKASNLIGYVTIVTGLLIGIGTFDLFDKLGSPISYVLFFVGLGFLILSIISSLICVKVKFYYEVPSVKEIKMIFEENWKYQTIIRQIFISRIDNQGNIDKHLSDKIVWLGRSWHSLVIGILVLVAFLISYIILK